VFLVQLFRLRMSKFIHVLADNVRLNQLLCLVYIYCVVSKSQVKHITLLKNNILYCIQTKHDFSLINLSQHSLELMVNWLMENR
jgi:hypothetical protein